MSNLGRYQDIVSDAKRAGGVDALIRTIEDAARAEGSARSYAKGFGVGAVVALAAGVGAIALRTSWVDRRSRTVEAEAARARLKAELGESTTSAADDDDSTAGRGSATEST